MSEWKTVPVVPTAKMLDPIRVKGGRYSVARRLYDAILAAAPEPAAEWLEVVAWREFDCAPMVLFSDAARLIAEREARIAELEQECSDLEGERDDAENQPWPEWAETILKIVRKRSGYDGFDDENGVDLPEELRELLAGNDAEFDRLDEERNELRARLADLEKAHEPVGEVANLGPARYCVEFTTIPPKVGTKLYAAPPDAAAIIAKLTQERDILKESNARAWTTNTNQLEDLSKLRAEVERLTARAEESEKDAAQWIDPNDKTQAQYLPHIGERVLFCHEGKTYYGQHTGGSFRSLAAPSLGVSFNTWHCRWMYPPKAIDAARKEAQG